MDDVEFISSSKNEENDVSDFNRAMSENEFAYEPVEENKHEYHNFEEIDDRKHVNLNVNNNLHESEVVPNAGGVPTRFTEINEQEISGEKTLYLSDSPFLLRQDLEVQRSAKLIVEPGVTIHFAPMVGITVYGQLKAIVSTFSTSLVIRRSRACAATLSYRARAKIVYFTTSVTNVPYRLR